jgi:hypothetical protein
LAGSISSDPGSAGEGIRRACTAFFRGRWNVLSYVPPLERRNDESALPIHLPVLLTHLQLLLTVFSVFRRQNAFLLTHLQLLLTVFGVFRRQTGILLTVFGVFRKQTGILLTHLQVLLTHFGRSRTICGDHLGSWI